MARNDGREKAGGGSSTPVRHCRPSPADRPVGEEGARAASVTRHYRTLPRRHARHPSSGIHVAVAWASSAHGRLGMDSADERPCSRLTSVARNDGRGRGGAWPEAACRWRGMTEGKRPVEGHPLRSVMSAPPPPSCPKSPPPSSPPLPAVMPDIVHRASMLLWPGLRWRTGGWGWIPRTNGRAVA